MARKKKEEEYEQSLSKLIGTQDAVASALGKLKSPLLSNAASLIEEFNLGKKRNEKLKQRLAAIAKEKSVYDLYMTSTKELTKRQKQLSDPAVYNQIQEQLQEQVRYMEKQKQMTLANIEQKKAQGNLTKKENDQLNYEAREATLAVTDAQNKLKNLHNESAEIQEALNLKQMEMKQSIANVAKKFEKTGKLLLELNNVIRETQKQFGVSAGQAGKIQAGAAIESVKSVFQEGPMVGRKEVMDAQSSFQDQFGGLITKEAASAIAKQAKELGISAEQLAESRRIFMTSAMGDLGQAKQQQTKFIEEFRKAGMTSKDAMKVLTQNSELFARNGTRFADSFTRAAIASKKIGVDLSKVDQIGDNIIGDFEGFLEKQAELGAMGFGFDSSRLAEVAETGDTGALLSELTSQLAATGKDITNLRRSEQLALSSAFGIPMAELQRLAGQSGSGEDKAAIDKADSGLSKFFNLTEKLGSAALLTNTLLTSISVSSAMTALNTGGLKGIKEGFGKLSNLFKGGSAATKAASTASTVANAASGASKVGGAMSMLGKGAKIGKGVLGKVALPLTALRAAYDGFKGFTADPTASFGGKLGNAASSAISGATFGLLGKDASEIAAEASTRPVRPTSATSPAPREATPQPSPTITVDMSELSQKLDQVVRAIAAMEVKMDGTKVGQVIATSEARASQSAQARAIR